MVAYFLRRLFAAAVVVLLVTITVFLAMRMLPGDPILMWYTSDQMSRFTPQQVTNLRHELGLDKPLAAQYFDWVGGVLHGDFGTSIRYHTPVIDEILPRLPVTLHLGILAFIIGFIVGVPAGVICAVRRGSWIDSAVTILTNIGITIPVFWLGILLTYVFALQLHWLPTYGYTSPFQDFWLSTRQLIMPVLCLALFPVASTARQTRSSMLEVMRQDYIRTAWAKGLRERLVVTQHALKNGLIPVITFTGLGLSGIIGGAVLIENVFAIPGMGRLIVSSVLNHDYAITQGVTLIIAIVIVMINLIVDVSYAWFDPRIRLG